MSAPVSYPVVSHDYCEQCQHTPLGHRGRDYATAVGSSVRATRGGEVVHTGWDGALGQHVVIETLGIRHLYAHLSEIVTEAGACLETGSCWAGPGPPATPAPRTCTTRNESARTATWTSAGRSSTNTHPSSPTPCHP